MRRVRFAMALGIAIPLALAAQPERAVPVGDTLGQQDRPCAGQPRTFRALLREYNATPAHTRASLVGTWVLIGSVFLGEDADPRHPVAKLLNCAGVQFDSVFAHVLTVERDSVTNDYGYAFARDANTHDVRGSLTILIEEGGDDYLVYRCRLTRRGTLACIEPDSHQGLEFQRMNAPPERRPSARRKEGAVLSSREDR